jgi:hypothetical protein
MADERMPRKPMPRDISSLQKQQMQLKSEKARKKRDKDGNRKLEVNSVKN